MRAQSTRRNNELDERTRAFYCHALRTLTQSELPFLVGGAYAFYHYTGITRHTKDLDVFVRPRDCEATLRVFADAGYHAELTFPHWLGKAIGDTDCVDVIFSSGNGIVTVDDEWFAHAPAATLLELPVRLIPAEEMLWSKSYVMERERYDGADITHLLRACARGLDWPRLLRRFAGDWRLLYVHLQLFGYVYPGERNAIPREVMRELAQRLKRETDTPPVDEHICRGTLLSREQYLPDIEQWHYKDARIERETMSPAQISLWTDAIGSDR